METLIDFVKGIEKLSSHAEEHSERWDRLNYRGRYFPELPETLVRVVDSIRKLGCKQHLEIDLDGVSLDIESFDKSALPKNSSLEWRLLLDKDSFINATPYFPDSKKVLFISQMVFAEWSKSVDPFLAEGNPILSHNPLRIIVHGLEAAFGGPRLAVCPLDGQGVPPEWPFDANLPSETDVKTKVHIATSVATSINPAVYLPTWGDVEGEAAEPLRVASTKVLVACLADDFYSVDKVVLRGVKRLELPLTKPDDLPASLECLRQLQDAVEWVYQERTETRAKLLSDRLSLDISDGQSLVAGVCRYLGNALKQSKEQYGFVILERKDAYIKEMRDLLKDVRSQADLYAKKVRNLLGNLLRDVLAALFLISLGLFSKISTNANVLASKEAHMLFKGLGVYFFASLLLQVIVNASDLFLSHRELQYWSMAARGYMGPEKIKEFLDEPIKPRRNTFYILVGVLALIYVGLALLSLYYREVFCYFGLIDIRKI